MTNDTELAEYLAQRYGGRGGLIVRDPESPSGLREWSDEDTNALARWVECNTDTQETSCMNLRGTAEMLGLSIQSTQKLMRRESHPLPHIRDGRRLLVPRFLLLQWMEDEVHRQLPSPRTG